ncbi:MAG: hypothetical protein QG632_588 [Candidatus Dependentiae bacterium]|nr:hypothetical protein [Candidatus Dependentiae bacterium]
MNRLFLFLCMATFGASVVANDVDSGDALFSARKRRIGFGKIYTPPARRGAAGTVSEAKAPLFVPVQVLAKLNQDRNASAIAGPSTPVAATPPSARGTWVDKTTWRPDKTPQSPSNATEPVPAPSFDPAPTLDFSGAQPVADEPVVPVADVTSEEPARSAVEPSIESPVDATLSSSAPTAPVSEVSSLNVADSERRETKSASVSTPLSRIVHKPAYEAMESSVDDLDEILLGDDSFLYRTPISPAPSVAPVPEPLAEEKDVMINSSDDFNKLSDRQKLALSEAIESVTNKKLSDFYAKMRAERILFPSNKGVKAKDLKKFSAQLFAVGAVPVSFRFAASMPSMDNAESAEFKSSHSFTPAPAGAVHTWSSVESLPEAKLKAALNGYARNKDAKDFVHTLGVIAQNEKAILAPAELQKFAHPANIQGLANKLGVDLELDVPAVQEKDGLLAKNKDIATVEFEENSTGVSFVLEGLTREQKTKFLAAVDLYITNLDLEDFLDTCTRVGVVFIGDKQEIGSVLRNPGAAQNLLTAVQSFKVDTSSEAKATLSPEHYPRPLTANTTKAFASVAIPRPIPGTFKALTYSHMTPDQRKEVIKTSPQAIFSVNDQEAEDEALPFQPAAGFEVLPPVLHATEHSGNADQNSFNDELVQLDSPTNVTDLALDDVTSGGNEQGSAKPDVVINNAGVTAVNNNVVNNANTGGNTPPSLANGATSTTQPEKKDYSKWEVGGGAAGFAFAAALLKSVSPEERGAVLSRLKSGINSNRSLTSKQKWAAVRMLSAAAAAAVATVAAGHGLYTMATKKNEAAAGN